MSSRLLAAARVAAARVAGSCRTAGSLVSLPTRRFSLEEFITTLKHELKHPESEHQGCVNTTFPICTHW